jgi:hypothetical protein
LQFGSLQASFEAPNREPVELPSPLQHE